MDAALLGVWCHGRAADCWVQSGHRPSGMTTSELLPEMRAVLHDCLLRGEPLLRQAR
jgi:NAD(P)H-hydrate repair Nnr-like enzyme with NAD(P)H-hydrate dehydratase domain